jgi:16S rRNA (cytosine967-C5)-methyltransferase
VQRARTIDHGIDELGRRPVRKLDPAVRAALRVAGYELAWSDAAAYAVADDAVELVRSAGLERAVGFTNAVARRLAEGFPALVASLPDGPLKESYPDWIWETWLRDWGSEEALALARAQNEPGELVVRSASPVGEATDVPGAWRVDRIDQDALAAGRIWPQSRGSQLAALVVGSQEGDRVLDACAAPGGKATMLRGEVTAVEVHPGRARELAENARRLGATHVRVVEADVRELGESDFDRALVDAPCSGLGVLARRPDLRWRAKPLPELQLELLRAVAERTKPGGTVVYSVCTLNADENEAVVDASGLAPEPLGEEWPQFAHPKRPEFLLTTPHRHATSGFFIARLRV